MKRLAITIIAALALLGASAGIDVIMPRDTMPHIEQVEAAYFTDDSNEARLTAIRVHSIFGVSDETVVGWLYPVMLSAIEDVEPVEIVDFWFAPSYHGDLVLVCNLSFPEPNYDFIPGDTAYFAVWRDGDHFLMIVSTFDDWLTAWIINEVSVKPSWTKKGGKDD